MSGSGRPSSTRGTSHGNKTKDIRDEVSAEMDVAPLVDATDVFIKNMNGDLALNGSVPGHPQYREAAAAARRVHGAASVENHLMVILPPRDYRGDPTLTTAANGALALNVRVPDGVVATANDGSVWLTGALRCESERKAAVRPAALRGRRRRCSR
jgi:osmotically-inducible protein OsmY